MVSLIKETIGYGTFFDVTEAESKIRETKIMHHKPHKLNYGNVIE
jgi:hypothetical protein